MYIDSTNRHCPIFPATLKMSSQQAFDSMRRKLIFLKICGFSSITIENGKSRTTFIDILCFFGALSFGLWCLYMTFISSDTFKNPNSSIAFYGNFTLMVASNCVSTLSMVIAFIFRHRIWSLFVQILKIDENV